MVANMFVTGEQIIRALATMPYAYGPKTASLLTGKASRVPNAEPFRRGYLRTFEERRELGRLLRLLDQRSRRLLFLWFVEGRPVAETARLLGISRVHCYRLKDKALGHMLEGCASERRVTKQAS
jgi:DNA-directed RNA polymerase specialized sigma24 family protein